MDYKKRNMYIISVLVGLFIFITQYRYSTSSNKLRCAIVEDEIRGVVSSKSEAHVPAYFIDNKKKWYTIEFPLSDTCFVIQPGDSMIKMANSKTILVKRGNLQCISRILCSE